MRRKNTLSFQIHGHIRPLNQRIFFILLRAKKIRFFIQLMYYKSAIYKILTLLGILLSGVLCLQAQEEKPTRKAIDSVMAISPDYLPTRLAPNPTLDFNPLEYTNIDTSLVHISQYDPLWRIENMYQSLGINGQAHKNMVFDIDRSMGFTMITLPYPLYFKKISDLYLYNLKTSYTDIDFTYGILSEFSFSATHAQHVRQADFVFNIDGLSNKGYFIHQATNRLSLSGLARYETPNKIYGFLLTYAFNHGKYMENGGLENCSDFTDRNARDHSISNDLSSFAVMFSNAESLINQHTGEMINYVNIKNKKGQYFGTFSHTLDVTNLRSRFLDNDLNNLFYRNRYYVSTDSTNDSIEYVSVANALQFSNYSPVDTIGDQSYFIRFAGGLRHEYVTAINPFYKGNSLTLFARTTIRLFKVWELYGNISYTLFGYNKNDAMTKVGARFTINKKHRHYLGLEASFMRCSPDYIYTKYHGNNNSWLNDWNKPNIFKAGAYWTMFGYTLSAHIFNLGKYIFLNDNFEPQQLTKPAQVIQLELKAPVRTKHFALDANMALQHSTNKAVTVPLFAGKLGAAFQTRIFKKKLHFQVGVDLFYNTRYFADGYNPILHQFYSQQYVTTGNYLYINAHIAFRVKRISFFIRGGDLIAGLFSYHYITTPGYPMQGRNFEAGVNWKFYD